MIKELKRYKCEHCGIIHETETAAIDCLESHNLIYRIQKYESNYDCWGKSDGDYEDTDIVFKHYIDAVAYVSGEDGLKISALKLS